MKWLAGAMAGAALALASSAQACSPPPVPNGAHRPPPTARAPPQAPVVIRLVALESASFPATARARVLEVVRGPYRTGQVIQVQPNAGSVCGPDRIDRGQAGLIYTGLPARPGGPVPLPHFWREPRR
jgi:hypothetical protein